jgi:hypothetical protein
MPLARDGCVRVLLAVDQEFGESPRRWDVLTDARDHIEA